MAKSDYAFGYHGTEHANLGCFIDGTYGESHAVQVMVGLLERVGRAARDAKEVDKLLQEHEDGLEDEFVSEWLDDATDLLQDNTEPGLVWEWDGGDLCLREEEDEEGEEEEDDEDEDDG